jgi:hypothetical protein
MTAPAFWTPPARSWNARASPSSGWPPAAPRRSSGPRSCGRTSPCWTSTWGGESGLELARRLSGQAGPAPVILISTHAEQDYVELIAFSPAVGFLPKTALSAGAIRELLAGRGDGASSS